MVGNSGSKGASFHVQPGEMHDLRVVIQGIQDIQHICVWKVSGMHQSDYNFVPENFKSAGTDNIAGEDDNLMAASDIICESSDLDFQLLVFKFIKMIGILKILLNSFVMN